MDKRDCETSETVATAKHAAGEAALHTTKQHYVRPELKTYGDLREITAQLAIGGNADGQIGVLNAILRTAILLGG
jgi:hypothetical protein